MINRNGQQNSIKTLDNFDKICKLIDNMPAVKLKDFNLKETAIIIVDMIEGFVRTGPLSNIRITTIIPKIIKLVTTCSINGIPIIAFADTHTENSPEFESFPSHCLQGTIESELIKELKIIEGIKVIPKNSINGAITTEFNDWLEQNQHIKNVIVIGCCTDLCIMQFALTLKALYNQADEPLRVIVPSSMVETYDYDIHDGDLLNYMALYMMLNSGIEVVKDIL